MTSLPGTIQRKVIEIDEPHPARPIRIFITSDKFNKLRNHLFPCWHDECRKGGLERERQASSQKPGQVIMDNRAL